jgi:hypothetical protein
MAAMRIQSAITPAAPPRIAKYNVSVLGSTRIPLPPRPRPCRCRRERCAPRENTSYTSSVAGDRMPVCTLYTL